MEIWKAFPITLSGPVLFIFQPASVAYSCLQRFRETPREQFLPQNKLSDTNKISQTKTSKNFVIS